MREGSGQPAIAWCFVPEPALTAGDVMLAQKKIALETDEAAVLALAHRFALRLPSLPSSAARLLGRPWAGPPTGGTATATSAPQSMRNTGTHGGSAH